MHTRVNVLPEPAQPKHTPPVPTPLMCYAEQLASLLRVAGGNLVADPADPLGEEYTDWVPLENLLPAGRCADFMFMGSVNGIYLYKHIDSRRYLNLDVLGRTYTFNAETSNYDPISPAAALLAVQR